jgi:tRNA A-37 threonylcarbamoyl transferase component Bud32
VVASAPKVVVAEWIEGIPLSHIIKSGNQDQRDLMGYRLFQLTDDAPRRLEMMHGDAHPGNFMLIGDKMGVIDFGAGPAARRHAARTRPDPALRGGQELRQVVADDGADRLHPEGRAGVHRRCG